MSESESETALPTAGARKDGVTLNELETSLARNQQKVSLVKL